MKQTLLEKRAQQVILQQIEERGEMSIDEIMELIKPHLIFDSEIARKQALRRKAHQIAAKSKDERGVRKNFAYNDTCHNIETTNSLEAVEGIIEKHSKVYDKYDADIKKAKRRRLELMGQQAFDFDLSQAE